MTIQQALRVLREENLIVSRQGRGVFVRERTARPVGLRPHIEAAFEQESQDRLLRLHRRDAAQRDPGAARQDPRRPADAEVDPATAAPVGHDRADGDPVPRRGRAGDDPRVRARMARTAQRYAGGIAESVTELADLELVQSAGVEVRVHSSAPLFKLYLINEHDLFWGFYP